MTVVATCRKFGNAMQGLLVHDDAAAGVDSVVSCYHGIVSKDSQKHSTCLAGKPFANL